jgi:hypothetical protein
METTGCGPDCFSYPYIFIPPFASRFPSAKARLMPRRTSARLMVRKAAVVLPDWSDSAECTEHNELTFAGVEIFLDGGSSE